MLVLLRVTAGQCTCEVHAEQDHRYTPPPPLVRVHVAHGVGAGVISQS
jgi:hypothetical protein